MPQRRPQDKSETPCDSRRDFFECDVVDTRHEPSPIAALSLRSTPRDGHLPEAGEAAMPHAILARSRILTEFVLCRLTPAAADGMFCS